MNPFTFGDPDDDWDLGDEEAEEIVQPIQPKMCQHVWIWYAGLAKAYYFCEKCGEEVNEI